MKALVIFESMFGTTREVAEAIGKVLSGKGYRLIAAPEQFRIDGRNPQLVPGEADRARAWGASLAQKSGA